MDYIWKPGYFGYLIDHGYELCRIVDVETKRIWVYCESEKVIFPTGGHNLATERPKDGILSESISSSERSS